MPVQLQGDGENSMICSVVECGKTAFRRGFCAMHYSRLLRRGEVNPKSRKAANGAVMAWIEQHATYRGEDCLFWPFGKFSNGYGAVNNDPRGRVASRVMCHAAHGKPPTPDHEAAHSCGNGHLACVSPNHLSWATALENDEHKNMHGTRNSGARNGRAKLSEDTVLHILTLLSRGFSHALIAAWVGVSRSTITRIATGKAWRTCQSNFRAMGKVA